MGRLNKLYLAVRAIPKTLYFNFHLLPLREALKLPFLISHRVHLADMSGSVRIEGPLNPAMIKIGFGHVGIFDQHRSRSVWEVSGQVVFKGSSGIGHGSKLSVSGELVLGRDFTITAESQIVCRKRITFGDGVLVSRQSLFMDSDFHKIKDHHGGHLLNADREVIVGDRVWFGCRCLILKGTHVGSDMVVAAGTTIAGRLDQPHSIVGGAPPHVLKQDIAWEV